MHDGIAILTNSDYGGSVMDGILCSWYNWKFNLPRNDYCGESKFDKLLIHLFSHGLESAKQAYTKMIEKDPSFSASEGYMSFLGYDLNKMGKSNEAITLLKLNCFIHPKAANAFDSLAEIYMLNGNRDAAIRNYTISLQLNPDNQAGKDNLAKLKAEANR